MQITTSITSPATAIRERLANSSRLRRTAVALVAAGAIAGAGVASQAIAQPATLKVTGNIETLLGPSPSCESATGLCFAGDVHGAVSGSIEGDLNNIAPTLQPDISLVDAAVTIHTNHGDLQFAHEQVVLNTAPNSNGEFSWLMEITGGTGRYAGATGYLQGAGTASPSTGESASTYVGEIALSKAG